MKEAQKILWQPSSKFIEQSNLKDYEKWLGKNKQLSFKDYDELWTWSTNEIGDFWESIWEYFNVISHQPYDTVLVDEGMPKVRWFEGAEVNYAEHIFRQKSNSRPALIFKNEHTEVSISWATLEKEVKAFQQFLIHQGIQKGDCVAAYLPNIPTAISCFLAVNSIGAVWTCCSPDFGEKTVIERFSQINPKLLIAVDGYSYGGKEFSRIESVKNIQQDIQSIQHTVFVPYLDPTAKLEKASLWQNILQDFDSKKRLTFTPVPFNHPIWVLYSSGTTGKPKAITHAHGGVLLEHLKYMSFHNDVKEGENFFWFTTTGWMMWNFLQASMLVGAVPVLFDGSPAHPSINSLWEFSSTLPIHHFGTSAPFLTACMKANLKLNEQFDFSNLRSLGSTGAPLPPDVFEWIYQHISKDIWLCSMSGGTDVCTAFVGGNPTQPVYKGYIQSRSLGCALYAYTADGKRIAETLGEMVIEQPMPSMPIYFWNDKDNERYEAAYFDTFPNKWRHGDWIKIEKNGSLIIQGRSDATLNRNGIRIGTAEIYSVLDEITAIKDSLIINLEQPNGEDIMPLFVVLEENQLLSDELQQLIKKNLRTQCSPRHVPNRIIVVPDIPYTLSGKKMEVPVKRILMKMTTKEGINRDAIRNPAAMDYFLKLTI